jgi:hypothetical protein
MNGVDTGMKECMPVEMTGISTDSDSECDISATLSAIAKANGLSQDRSTTKKSVTSHTST